ncbi:thiopurine S-methyltransferase [Shewanella waksmanii]|uniref:thiopurine S-methyltransferase n=1 Tax=Shewanella waksmanii TaxID=213783 RepID=UPI00048D471A|nr:thiopurine S-methyltransferase [Shewanella waksmanii]
MQPNFWHEKWAAAQIGFHLDAVNPLLIKYWPSLGLAQQSQVFVPLCGKTLDMCFLAEQGHEVIGCELSEQAVQQFFTDNNLAVNQTISGAHQCFTTEQIALYQGDIFTLPAEVTQQAVGFYDRAALIAWPESMRSDYAKRIAELIAPKSIGLLVTLDYPQEALKGPPFAVSDDWVNRHLSADFSIELLHSEDVLDDNQRFVSKGVPWLTESVYRLVRKG